MERPIGGFGAEEPHQVFIRRVGGDLIALLGGVVEKRDREQDP